MGTGTDCAPLITYQDKELKCQFCSFFYPLAFFDIWHFPNAVCVPRFLIVHNGQTEKPWKCQDKFQTCPVFFFFFSLFLNNHRRGMRASLIENVLFVKWWETKWPLSVGRKLLVRLICMAPHVSAIVIMGANEFLCLASALIPAAILRWEATSSY